MDLCLLLVTFLTLPFRSLTAPASISLAASTTTIIKFNAGIGAASAVPISRSLADLSIEFCYITDYFGDVGKPNQLTLHLLQNIQDILGAPPLIRIGGHTQDVAQYNLSNPETLSNVFEPGNLEAVSVTFNSNLFRVLNDNAVSSQQFIFGLNLGQDNIEYPLAEVAASEAMLDASRLYAYELGNEPDFYNVQRPLHWNVQVYAEQQIDWISKLNKEVVHPGHGFQLGGLAQEPIYQGNFSLGELTTFGLPKILGSVKSYSDHTYPYSMCSNTTAALVSLPNLMNHINTIQYFSQWQTEIASSKLAGVPFFLGETGSVSCHGKNGVSNTLGAALWEIDYMLHGATLGFQGVFFHMGTPFYYSMWQPVAYNNTPATVYPTYYSLLLIADLLADMSAPNILELSEFENNNLAVYAIYEGSKFSKLVVLNLEYYSDSSTDRPTQTIDVTAILGLKVKALRLTGPLSNTTSVDHVTWIGQTYVTGQSNGSKNIELYHNGTVEVAASEAVIILRQ